MTKEGKRVETIARTFKIIKKKPSLLLLWGAIFLVTGVISQINPIFNLMFHFGISGQGNVFETIITSLRMTLEFLSESGYMPAVILGFMGILIIVSLLLAVIFSGGFNIMNSELLGKRSTGSFKEGVRNYFLKFSVVNFIVLLFGTVFIIFMSIVAVPALVISSSWINGKPELMTSALFVDFITLMALFFGFMFFRSFLLFWYPALLNVQEKAFTIGKRVADNNFWPVVGGLTLFDIVFLAVEFLFIVLSAIASEIVVIAVLIFIFRWVFETLFFLTFGVFILDRFNRYYAKTQ